MNDLVITREQNNVFEIILNRPDKRNAINLELYKELDSAIQKANRAIGIRAVLVRGEGAVFSSGIDLTALLQLSQEYGPMWQQRMRSITHDFQAVLTKLEQMEVPTIAILHGYCLGLAFEVALACDIRLAVQGTMLGLPETRLGIIPDVGGTTRLTRIAGPARAKELIFTGRQFEAESAVSWGIINYVVAREELDGQVSQLIEEISLASPLAVGMAKRVIDGFADIERGLIIEGWAQSQLFSTEDFQEAVQAYMMKRTPEFKGR